MEISYTNRKRAEHKMVGFLFQKIAKMGNASGISDNDRAKARDWYNENAARVTKTRNSEFFMDRKNLKKGIDQYSIGRMYMFMYDAKTKDQLPYWDAFPLVFPIEMYNDGFLGINLHYLPPLVRAAVMAELYIETVNNNNFDDSSRLKINYEKLMRLSRSKFIKPCVKRYLTSHIKSQFYYVEPKYWDIALVLPTERFQKQSKATVYKESTR